MENKGKANEALEIKLEEEACPSSQVNSDKHCFSRTCNLPLGKVEKEREGLELDESHLDTSIISTVTESNDDSSEAPFSAVGIHLEKFWSFATDYLLENWAHFKMFVYIVLAALYNTYFIACIYYARMNSLEIDWCDGVGLLILLTAVTYAGLFYYQIVKRFWGRAIYRLALLPMRKAFLQIWAFR